MVLGKKVLQKAQKRLLAAQLMPRELKVVEVLLVKNQKLVHQRKERLLLIELKVVMELAAKYQKLVHRGKVRQPLVSILLLLN